MRWETVREGRVTVAGHERLAALLRAAFPRPGHFAGSRSWSHLRPELRVIGWSGTTPVATAGVLRRVVEVGGRDQPVAIVGLVAVHPDGQGRGTGRALVVRVEEALRELDVPFGVLLCGPDRVEFYRRAGWVPVDARVRYLADDTTVPTPVVEGDRADTMLVLPVRSPLSEWPDGDVDWHCATV